MLEQCSRRIWRGEVGIEPDSSLVLRLAHGFAAHRGTIPVLPGFKIYFIIKMVICYMNYFHICQMVGRIGQCDFLMLAISPRQPKR